MLSDFTDPATVRALLGVNDLELEDAQLNLEVYVLVVEAGLDELSTGAMPMYDAVKAVPEATRTSAQRRYFSLVQVYSATLVAIALLPSLPLAVPRRIGDEKAVVERVNDPFKLLSENMAASLAVLGSRLKAALSALDPTFSSTTVSRRFASVVGLSPDPVVGV